MWRPDPAWERIPGGRSSLTIGLWRVEDDSGSWIVKRVAAPGPDDPVELEIPAHPGYWRRELEVARWEATTRGLVRPGTARVETDGGGFTLWTPVVEPRPTPALMIARCLGRFAGTGLPDEPWISRQLLSQRIHLAEVRGGWPTLARTALADLADLLWRRRTGMLQRYDALPQHAAHGDVVPRNLVAARDDDVVAVDWGQLGLAPAGADLGYFALSSRIDLDVLLEAHARGLAEAGVDADPDDVRFAARVMLVYTVVAQAEWALARVATGEGALAGKLRHPAVAPYLRALERALPHLEALIL